jgi:hypothetical protein
MSDGMPFEIWEDGEVPVAVKESMSRGRARAYFTRERGIPFTAGKLTKIWFRRDPDYERDVLEEGGSEPDEGWPVWACSPGDERGEPYWYFSEGGRR